MLGSTFIRILVLPHIALTSNSNGVVGNNTFINVLVM